METERCSGPTVSPLASRARRLAVTLGCEPRPCPPESVLSIDDYVITSFNAGQTQTFPLFIFGATRQGVPPEVNVLATMLLSGRSRTATQLKLRSLMAG